jgi:hypothetical protein
MGASVGGSKQSSESLQNAANWAAGNGANLGAGFGTNQSLNQSGSAGTSNSGGTSQSGGSSFGNSQGSSQGNSQSTQDVWGAQSPYINDVYQNAQGQQAQAQNAIDGMQGQVQGQVGDAFGTGNQAFNNLAGGGAQGQMLDSYGNNPYVDAMKGQVAQDANLLKQQNLGSLEGRAAAAGMGGSSGFRNQVQDMTKNVDENAMDQMSKIGYDSFSQSMKDKMALSQGVDANVANAMGNTGNMQNAAMNQFNPAMAGMGLANQYSQIIGGPTVLGNSSSNNVSNNNSVNGATNFANSNNFANSVNNAFSNGMSNATNMNGSLGFNQNYGGGSNTGTSSSNGKSLDVGFG